MLLIKSIQLMFRLRLLFFNGQRMQFFSNDVESLIVTLHVWKVSDLMQLKHGWIDFLRSTYINENRENYVSRNYNYLPLCSICNETNYLNENENYIIKIKQQLHDKVPIEEQFQDFQNININVKQNKIYETNIN